MAPPAPPESEPDRPGGCTQNRGSSRNQPWNSMNLASSSLRRPTIGPRAMVALAGIVAGTLDLIYAATFWGIQKGLSPLQILQSVAAGWLGRATFEGGYPSALLGLVSHYGIAITMAAVFRFASRRWPALVHKPLLTEIGRAHV